MAPEPATLTGAAARRALAKLLPYANESGASARRVREAAGVLESIASVDQLVYRASVAKRGKSGVASGDEGAPLTRLPAGMRLAMEMVLHDEDEERAMHGELTLLERRWREAEELAGIADSLLLPENTERRIQALRGRKDV